MKFKPAPLPSSFFLTSIVGFLITAIYWNAGKIDDSWGFTFIVVFGMMFIASLISMSKADAEAELLLDHHIKKHHTTKKTEKNKK